MIISHKHRYVFVEMPHTASSSISQELCAKYSGEKILHKHALLSEFQKIASDEELQYLKIIGTRNPLDTVVTRYYKRKTNHQEFFTTPHYWRKNGGHVSNKSLKEFKFIQDQDAGFQDYFKRFYFLPYDNFGCTSPKDYDFIIRFEYLEEDFASLIQKLGIIQVGHLPRVNPTDKKKSDFSSYFTADIQKRALWVFGPFMNLWHYKFPPSWIHQRFSRASNFLFYLMRPVRREITRYA